jgi:DNA-binding SARP family transcriptional activator
MKRTVLACTPRRAITNAAAVALGAVLSIATPAAAATFTQEPGTVGYADDLNGAILTEPTADAGQIRGQRFSIDVTGVGPVESYRWLTGTMVAGPGEELLAIVLTFRTLPGENDDDADGDQPIVGSLLVDGTRLPVPRDAFRRSGERILVASVPTLARDIRFVVAEGDVEQAFSLPTLQPVGSDVETPPGHGSRWQDLGFIAFILPVCLLLAWLAVRQRRRESASVRLRLRQLVAARRAAVAFTSEPTELATTEPVAERLAKYPDPIIDLTAPAPPRPLQVHLLGAFQIAAGDNEVASGLRSKARELLAFLAVHPEGATAEKAIDTVLPDATPAKGASHLHTLLNNLRTTLRNAAELDEDVPIVERTGNRYLLNPTVVDVDVWDFEQSLQSAVRGEDQLTARTRAAERYRADLLADEFYPWAETARQDLRRRTLDNLTVLADLLESDGQIDGSITALERAITIDPYAEATYQQLAALQERHGRADAAARTRRLFETRLAELDNELA